MKILAIESSCDETAAAVTEGRTVLSNVVSTQIEEHKIYGGVVPEIASRRHIEAISEVVRRALEDAKIGYSDIGGVAVTFAPGLIGALLVGVNFAKGLSLSLGVPLIPVHHLRSHIAANYIAYKELKPPFLCLTVSGGNTHITAVEDYTRFRIIGRTRDDAAGECLDKIARSLGLPYPGGVNLDKIAAKADERRYPLPTPNVEGCEFDFSFSGLKTAALNLENSAKMRGEEIDVPTLCATVRKKICDMLIEKTLSAARQEGFNKIALAGGVSANSELRARMQDECDARGYSLYRPPLCYCGDNAAMVGVQGYYEFSAGNISNSALNAAATLPIDFRS